MNDITYFERFWSCYPRKVGKGNAEKSWKKLPIKEKLGQILIALETQKKSKQWQDFQYIPHPVTWLNQRRWEDESPELSGKYKNL